MDKETVLESLSAEERYDYDLRKSVQLFNLTKVTGIQAFSTFSNF